MAVRDDWAPGEVLTSTDLNDTFKKLRYTVVTTTLPASPSDGDVIEYVADSTNGVRWRFRYNASSSSSYKWEFVGGGSWYSAIGEGDYGSGQARSSLNFGDLSTVGPTFTAPFGGDYIATAQSNFTGGGSTTAALLIWKTGDGTPSWQGADAFLGVTINAAGHVQVTKRLSSVSATDVIKMQYAVSNDGVNVTWYDRRMTITPIRIG